MSNRNLLRLFPLSLVLVLVLSIGSCSKEDRFENWLTKKEGTWKVTSASESVVGYNGNDSLVTDNPNSSMTGDFVFNEDGSFDYDFAPEELSIQFQGSGDRLIDGKTFSHFMEGPSLTEDVISQWVSGEKTSARTLEIKMRMEWANLSGLYLAANFDLVMERAD